VHARTRVYRGVLGTPPIALADLGCSNATLKGTYIYAYDGWQIDADNVRKPFAFSGIETYNGDGTLRGIFSGSTDGVGTSSPA
jgi:hypothetical protein